MDAGLRVRWLAAALACVAGLLATAPVAQASGGYVRELRCLGLQSPCSGLPTGFDALGFPLEVAAGDDPTLAFAIGACCGDTSTLHQDGVVALRRAADGTLSLISCVARPAGGGCSGLPEGNDALAGLTAVATTGPDVYVGNNEAVTHLRLTDGSLRFVDCIGAVQGCAPVPTADDPFDPVAALALSPDGRDLYAAGRVSVVHFRRGQQDGRLSFADCVNGRSCASLPRACTSSGCASLLAFGSLQDLAVDPRGESVYVVSSLNTMKSSNAVTRLRRAPDGTLSFASCLGQGLEWCAETPAGRTPLSGVTSVVVGPRGDIYTAGYLTGSRMGVQAALAHVHPNADGSLRLDDCLGTSTPGCAELPGSVDVLGEVGSLAISPDGSNLYASARGLWHVALDTDGAMALASCVELTGCPGGRAGHQSRGQKTAISADGRQLYVSVDADVVPLALQASPFTASGTPPSATTGGTHNLSAMSVDLQGTFAAGDHRTRYWFEWGTTTAYGHVLAGDGLAAGTTSAGHPDAMLGDLLPGTTYHYRAVAGSVAGVARGVDRTFTTPRFDEAQAAPDVDFWGYPDLVSRTSALVPCRIDTGFLPTRYAIEYGPTTSYGSQVEGQVAGASNWVKVEYPLTGLRPATTYHFRCRATNAKGGDIGADWLFSTWESQPLPPAPEARADVPSDPGATSAALTGTINPRGRATDYRFEIARGIDGPWTQVGTTEPAGAGSSDVAVRAVVAGLTAQTSYVLRLVAKTPLQELTSAPVAFRTGARDPAPPPPPPPPSPQPQPQPGTTTPAPQSTASGPVTTQPSPGPGAPADDPPGEPVAAPSRTEGPGKPPTPARPAARPTVSLTELSVGQILSGGLRVRIRCPARCATDLTVSLGGRAIARLRREFPAGTRVVRMRLGRQAARRLRVARRPRLVLRGRVQLRQATSSLRLAGLARWE